MDSIILIDDDEEVLEINKKYLTREGFHVITTVNALRAIAYLKEKSVDCIIMDVMMPHMDGFTACKKIREFTNAPIILLTGRSTEDDKLKGLLIGADDYIVKPYSLKELTARINVQIRRQRINGASIKSGVIDCPPIQIDTTEHIVTVLGTEVPLSNREYSLILYLVSNPNKELTFEDIGQKIWGVYSESDRRSIMVNVSRLRKKIEEYAGSCNMIDTVWSKGYKFIPSIKK